MDSAAAAGASTADSMPQENVSRARTESSCAKARSGSGDRCRARRNAVSPVRVKQHSASIQIFADGDSHSRMVWIADVLPNEIGPYIDGQMDLGAAAMQKQFRRDAA